MNMLINFVRNAIGAASSLDHSKFQVRTEIVRDHNGDLVVRPVQNYRHLKSRGKNAKPARTHSGVRAIKRAAAKRRNRKG